MTEIRRTGDVTALREDGLVPRYRQAPRVTWTDWSDRTARHSVVVEGRTTLIGSAPDAGISVKDPTLSRIHAELEVRQDGVWIRDLDSRNGTFVDGLRVTGARVPPGAKVRLGATDFVLSTESQTQPVELWPSDSFGPLVGGSASMRELFALLSRVSPANSSVLIHGETGTGKELIARAIHEASPRADKPFVVVDCGALPENLLDAELFGHAKGAFTGAVNARAGAIEEAEGGVVFLDEIGELPLSMQPKLLRALESHSIRRLGETNYRHVDVRFLSATHRDLLKMVAAGQFREDLYFRLSVLPVTVPPLRSRLDDVERLANHFWKRFGGEGSVSPDLIRALAVCPWRGNVRELRNFVERARTLGAAEALAMLSSDGSSPPIGGYSAPGANAPFATPDCDPKLFECSYKEFRDAWVDTGEREYVRRLLVRNDRNVALAAREAGVDRTYIYRLIRKHDL